MEIAGPNNNEWFYISARLEDAYALRARQLVRLGAVGAAERAVRPVSRRSFHVQQYSSPQPRTLEAPAMRAPTFPRPRRAQYVVSPARAYLPIVSCR